MPLFEDTVRQNTVRLGREDPGTLVSMNNLAEAYRTAGQFEKAMPLYEETLRIKVAKFGPDHPDTLRTKGNLESAYIDAGQFAGPSRSAEETLHLSRRNSARPPGNPDDDEQPRARLPIRRPV